MDYIVNFDKEIANNSNVIVPISMGQEKQTGAKLQALIHSLSHSNVTILICDYLYRHNTSEENSLKMGDDFLNKYSDLFKLSHIKGVFRWKQWIEKYQEEYTKYLQLVRNKSTENTLFFNRLSKTINKLKIEKQHDKSLEFLREECAVVLTFKADYLVYISNITPALKQLYADNDFKNIIKPTYVNATLKLKKLAITFPSHNNEAFIYEGNNKTSLPVSLKIPLESIKMALESGEIADNAKISFIYMLENIINEAKEKLKSDNLDQNPITLLKRM